MTSDTFEGAELGLQWQWQANPEEGWASLSDRPGQLRLFAQPLPQDAATLFDASHLLLQKFPAPVFQATAELDASALAVGDAAGLIVFGFRYAFIGLRKDCDGFTVFRAEGDEKQEQILWSVKVEQSKLFFQVIVRGNAQCTFNYSLDDKRFAQADGMPFPASESRWVGAKVGLFALRGRASANFDSYVDAASFQVCKAYGSPVPEPKC